MYKWSVKQKALFYIVGFNAYSNDNMFAAFVVLHAEDLLGLSNKFNFGL